MPLSKQKTKPNNANTATLLMKILQWFNPTLQALLRQPAAVPGKRQVLPLYDRLSSEPRVLLEERLQNLTPIFLPGLNVNHWAPNTPDWQRYPSTLPTPYTATFACSLPALLLCPL